MKIKDSTLVQRLAKAMKDKQINARELAERANVGQSFVYDIINGKSKNPTIQKLSSIARVLEVSVLYLIYGQYDQVENTITHDMISVPQIIASSVINNIAQIQIVESRPNMFHCAWIKNELKSLPENLRIVEIHGDNMYPTLSQGDIVLIDISKKSASPTGMFAVFDGISINVKRLEYLGSGANARINVSSDNDKYKSYEILPDELQIIGKAVWLSKSL